MHGVLKLALSTSAVHNICVLPIDYICDFDYVVTLVQTDVWIDPQTAERTHNRSGSIRESASTARHSSVAHAPRRRLGGLWFPPTWRPSGQLASTGRTYAWTETTASSGLQVWLLYADIRRGCVGRAGLSKPFLNEAPSKPGAEMSVMPESGPALPLRRSH